MLVGSDLMSLQEEAAQKKEKGKKDKGNTS